MAKREPRAIQVLNRDGLGEEVFDSLLFRLAHQVDSDPELRELAGFTEYEADMAVNHLQGMGVELPDIPKWGGKH